MKFWNFSPQGETVELRIDGDLVDDGGFLAEWLGGGSASEFRKELSQYKGKNVTVWVNSYGGDVFAGVGMFNALMAHKKTGGHVTTYGEKVYSAAVMPFLAGDQREMTLGGILMVHNPLTSVYGYADDLRKAAASLDKVKESIVNIYESATGIDRETLSNLMDRETEMTAKEAVESGMATGIADLQGQENKAADYKGIVNSVKTARAGLMKYIDLSQRDGKEPAMAEIRTLVELRNAYPALIKEAEDMAVQKAKADAKDLEEAKVKDAVQKERERIAALDALDDGSEAVRKILNHAKAEGQTAGDIAFYVDTVKEANGKAGSRYMDDALKDSEESGAQKVGVSAEMKPSTKDIIERAVARAVKKGV